MARPLRIQYPGALYHVTARGDRKEVIYEDDRDRLKFLDVLDETARIYNWAVLSYCLMGNHYHLVVETPDANLSQGMRHLNGVYTQASNRRHDRVGHVFQGRYKAILVDANAYLLEVSRYVVLNPVRAGLVTFPHQWRWSSYDFMLGKCAPPDWLQVNRLLGQFDANRKIAVQRYRRFVMAGIDGDGIWEKRKRQIYLGDEQFIERALSTVPSIGPDVDIPGIQRRPPAPSISEIASRNKVRNQAIAAAYATGEYSYRQIGEFFDLHLTTIAYIVRRERGGL